VPGWTTIINVPNTRLWVTDTALEPLQRLLQLPRRTFVQTLPISSGLFTKLRAWTPPAHTAQQQTIYAAGYQNSKTVAVDLRHDDQAERWFEIADSVIVICAGTEADARHRMRAILSQPASSIRRLYDSALPQLSELRAQFGVSIHQVWIPPV
jgi:hypothetical protein